MSVSERHDALIAALTEKSPQSINELVERFGVTPATIRRDLKHLEKTGAVVKTRGTAHIISNGSVPKYQFRQEVFSAEKLAIAKAAIRLTEGVSSVILDSGTSVQAYASQLAGLDRRLTVITNSLPLSTILAPNSITAMFVGGLMYGEDFALVGPDADDGFCRVKAEMAIMGTTGISRQGQLTTFSPLQSSVKKSMIKAAEKVIVLADASKFTISGSLPFAGPDNVDVLITAGGDYPPGALEPFHQAGVEVIVAD